MRRGQKWGRKIRGRRRRRGGRKNKRRKRAVVCYCFRFYIHTEMYLPGKIHIFRNNSIPCSIAILKLKILQPWYLCNLYRKFLSCFQNWKKVTNAMMQNTSLKKVSLLSKQSCIWHIILTNNHKVCKNLLVSSAT